MQKNKVFNIIMGIIVIITFVLFSYSIVNPFLAPTQLDKEFEGLTIGIVNKNTTLTQKFISQLDSLDSIQIQYATFNKENEQGKLIAEIYNQNNKKIFYDEYNIKDIKDNQSLTFEFDVQEYSKGKEYTLNIKVEDITKDEIITFYALSDLDEKVVSSAKLEIGHTIRIYQYGENRSYFYTIIILMVLFIEIFIWCLKIFKNKNNIELKKYQKIAFWILYLGISLLCAATLVDIGMDIVYENRLPALSLPLFCLSTLIIIIIITKCLVNKNLKLEKIFLILAIPLSSLYLLCIVPGSIPDEPYHYRLAYQVSKGNFLLINKVSYRDGNKVYFGYERARQELFDKSKDSTRLYKDKNGGYNPILYIFSAIGILIGRIFNFTLLGTKYVGCFFNLLLFLVSGYFIIKLLPYGKRIGIVYLLNPMNLQQMTSLSCDAMINASTLLFISYILYLKESAKKLKIRDTIILSIFILIILLCKYAYFPLLLLLFLIKNNIDKTDKKTKKIFGVLILIIIIIFTSIYKYNNYLYETNKVFDTTEVKIEHPQTNYTKLQYALTSPTKVAYIILNTLASKIDFYITTFAGGLLGSLNIIIPNYIVTLYLILLIISSFFDSEKNTLNKKEKIIMFIIFLFNFIVVLAGLYFGWGDTRDLFVEGVQGRYFIPFFILPLIIIQSKNIKFDIKNKNLIISILLLFINLYSIVEIMLYYLD